MNLKKKFKHFLRYIGRLPLFLNLIGSVAGAYVWLVGKTGRFKVRGIEEFERLIKENDGGIFVCWHGRALMLPYFWSNLRQMKALVSPHADGRIIARLLRMFHILSIDGSSDRNARGAALEIVKELNAGTVVSLISDGPTGPGMRLNKSGTKPLFVPADADEAEMERLRLAFETELNALTAEVDKECGVEGIVPGHMKKKR